MSKFEVTTINRLTARKLLGQCGVRPEMARSMSLRQLKEHLENFVQLGNLELSEVQDQLQAAQIAGSGGAPNTGTAWDSHQDQELAEHYNRGMSVDTMASIRGRTRGGIQARLEKLGFIKYRADKGRYVTLVAPTHGRDQFEGGSGSGSGSGSGNKSGEFMDADALDAMERDVRQEKAGNEEKAAKDNLNELSGSISDEGKTAVDEIARKAISKLGKMLSATDSRVTALAQGHAELTQNMATIIADEVKKVQGAWQRFEIKTTERVHKIEGLAHKAFPKLLRAVSARTRHDGGALNIWLYGPAGTGKSTAARKLAEAFSMPFHTNGPVGSQWDIRGFTDAQGRIVETAFRKAWIGGGVYCWDEGDGSAPAALIEANGALATGFASFPDGVYQRHADCIVIINGNLRPGAAPDATYNGRYKQDTAFVNRFVAIEWGIDEDLERALLGKLNNEGEQWLRFIKTLRQKIAQRGIKGIVVSPRQTQYGLALLDAGAPMDEVLEQTVKFMFTDEQWKQVAA